jgi:hypothetical protein
LGHPLSECDTVSPNIVGRQHSSQSGQFQKRREGDKSNFTGYQPNCKPALTIPGFLPERHSGKLVFFDTLHLENVLGTILTVNGIADTVSSRNYIERLTLAVLCEVMTPETICRQATAQVFFKTVANLAIDIHVFTPLQMDRF